MSKILIRLPASLLAVALVASAVAAPPGRRAKRPEFTPSERAVFFADVASVLDGPRPDFGRLAETRTAAAGSITAAGGGDAGASEQWGPLITTDTVENEIKRQAQRVAEVTASATTFKGGGYRQARDAFSTLALMFRVAAEHENDARWRDIAPGLSTLFGRAAANCKVGTDGSYREAAARSQDLTDLVRGSRPDVPAGDPDQLWSDLADRSPIMKRIEDAQQKQLGPLLGSGASFSRSAEDAAHAAQILAFLSEVLTREEFIDAGDEEYDAFARAMRDAAADISRAADQDDYPTAREAYGRLNKACSDCHDLYRG
ncbi:hypothetical protein Pla123a_38820 [Posidoniimonas polymericola]|uniref:Cytochrome C n=1 Tax=Posidoniimonas polymericola TaxID=2528002 RepID=A0A5C5YCX1_9BACT|nr:cytochrome c [Posidoniimonas polymericola]TWT73546.1 hypothetical protein Pla123a_38820 [Posidoniimonas polymericola]